MPWVAKKANAAFWCGGLFYKKNNCLLFRQKMSFGLSGLGTKNE
jgi:hypothetical protein